MPSSVSRPVAACKHPEGNRTFTNRGRRPASAPAGLLAEPRHTGACRIPRAPPSALACSCANVRPMAAILDHIGITVRDYAKSKAFYEKALAPLGIGMLMDFGVACGFGRDGKPDLWLGAEKRAASGEAPSGELTP